MAEEAKAPVSEVERAEIPWLVAYLREDIQDLRSEVREVRRSVQRLEEKIDARSDGLDAKIEGLRRERGVQFRWVLGTMVAMGGLIVAALKLLP